jgi:putative hydrolase of HD superfamily
MVPFFDLLRKIALCDIKAPIQKMIHDEYPEEYVKLNQWVVGQYRDVISDEALFADFSAHVLTSCKMTILLFGSF